jgi:hypothetical protein
VVNALVENAREERVKELVELPVQAVAIPRSGVLVRIKEIPLGTKESRVRDLAIKRASIREILESSDLEPDEALAVVRALYVLGAVDIDQSGGAAREPARSSALSRPPPARGSVSTPEPVQATETAVQKRISKPPPARKSRSVSPNLPGQGLPDIEETVGPEGSVKGDAAELWAAHNALIQGDAKTAQRTLRRLTESDAENVLYHLYLGWANSIANPKAVKIAERCLLEAARLDPESPYPYLLAAEVYRRSGDFGKAKDYEEMAAERGSSSSASAAAEGPKPKKKPSIQAYMEQEGEIDMDAELQSILKDYDKQQKGEEEQQGKKGLLGRILKK